MTPEEKAKAYDEAIKKAAALYKASEPMSGCNVIIETLFPELKKSEGESGDEKIRKAIIEGLREMKSNFHTISSIKIDDAIAWLENQKDCIKLSNSAYTSNRDVIKFADKYSHTVWENLMDKFKKIENYSIGCNDVSDIVLNAIINTYNWLRKQYKQKLVISDDALREGIAHFGITQYQIDNWLKKYIDVEIQGKQKHKFNIGDIISNGQAVFRVDNIIKNCIGQDCYFLVNIEDEKKGLRYLILTDSRGNHSHFGEITWLCEQVDKSFEKQGEQKPTNKLKPKFNIGDWITNGIDVDKIIGIDLEDENYLFENSRKSDISLVDSNSHRWTIKDVKNGDILAVEPIDNYQYPFVAIYKERGLDFFNSHCFIGFYGNFYEGEEGHAIENIHPATKEQCLLLFQKMHEAGYEWDDEKKELKKIKVNEAMYDDDKLREAICE